MVEDIEFTRSVLVVSRSSRTSPRPFRGEARPLWQLPSRVATPAVVRRRAGPGKLALGRAVHLPPAGSCGPAAVSKASPLSPHRPPGSLSGVERPLSRARHAGSPTRTAGLIRSVSCSRAAARRRRQGGDGGATTAGWGAAAQGVRSLGGEGFLDGCFPARPGRPIIARAGGPESPAAGNAGLVP